eukprot:TRINITY_DN1952_c0_g1_i1.p1 TRINITY_DN1952_c0_g1~~TRINITY_DN1952_c0_g1_i1.p1  ORF type:complete len:281 (-),score=27.09 TRINITY_DN1952_c0_g1_i1:116-958(-)
MVDLQNQTFTSTRGNSMLGTPTLLGNSPLPSPALLFMRTPTILQGLGTPLVIRGRESNGMPEPTPRTPIGLQALSFAEPIEIRNAHPIVLANGIIMNPVRREDQISRRPLSSTQEFSSSNRESGEQDLSSSTQLDQLNRSINEITLSSPRLPMLVNTGGDGQVMLLQSSPFSVARPAYPQTSDALPRNLFNRMSDSIFRIATSLQTSNEKSKIGSYTREERIKKIRNYRSKVQKWREKHPINRNFKGRSRAAIQKPRINGRFVKVKKTKPSEEKKGGNLE